MIVIHCIWYCFQGSNIQPSDCDFIKKLLNIYTTFSIPIIFVHAQTLSIRQSDTCKKGIENYLKLIYPKENSKVEELLKRYINILAREDEGKQAFGLNELEILTKKEIETKGFKSAYFELIKKDIYPILINGLFNLVFTENNLKQLKDSAIENLDKYLETIYNILNSSKLDLNEEAKNNNKTANNSSLPASIHNDKIHFTPEGSHAKFSTGPK